MDKELDWSNAQKNPYFEALTRLVTLRLGHDEIAWFAKLADDAGMMPEELMSFYLRDAFFRKYQLEFDPPRRKRSTPDGDTAK